MFAELDAVAPRDVWQREFARALQTWANHSNLNFFESTDDGTMRGLQGTIRLAAIPHNYGIAYAVPPSTSLVGGDIVLNANASFAMTGFNDLYTTLVHESGHSLGLGHTLAESAVMRAYAGRPLPGGVGLDDIISIQALYGARQPDAFDAAAANDSFATATSLQPADPNSATYSADLTSHADVDYYRITIPAGTKTLTVAVDARELSLLAPKIAVYDQFQNLIATATGKYGTVAAVEIPVTPGQTYTLVADGATDDEFGMGAYRLNVEFTRDETQPLSDATELESPPETPPPVDDSSQPTPEPDQNEDTGDTIEPTVPGTDNGDTTPTVDPSGAGDAASGATPQTGNDSQSSQTHSESGLLMIRVTRRRLLASGGTSGESHEPTPATQNAPAETQQTDSRPSLSSQLSSSSPPVAVADNDDADAAEPEAPGDSPAAVDTIEPPSIDPAPDPAGEDDQPTAGNEPASGDAETPTSPPPSRPAIVSENTTEPAGQPVVIRVTRRGATVTPQPVQPSNQPSEENTSNPPSPADVAAPADPAVPVVEENSPNTEAPVPQQELASPENELPRRIGLELLIASATRSTATQQSIVSPRLHPSLVDLAIQGI
ncbi:MAG: matrixin family metalloprotease [Rhodopirellula sp.]|nr:matrixin family metalloprotease [Rhodopirellula sp.]